LRTTATLANGKHYSNDCCFVFELRDGLIHRVREYVDTARAQRMIFGEAGSPATAGMRAPLSMCEGTAQRSTAHRGDATGDPEQVPPAAATRTDSGSASGSTARRPRPDVTAG
jgi:hypothetical protein